VTVTSSGTWPFDTLGPISYRCSIITESLCPAVFEIINPDILGSRPWPFRSHDVIRYVTIRCAVCAISYRCSVVTEALSPTILKIFGTNTSHARKKERNTTDRNTPGTGNHWCTGCASKNNPLGKIRYLWNCSKFFRQVNHIYRGGRRPHILLIPLQYIFAF